MCIAQESFENSREGFEREFGRRVWKESLEREFGESESTEREREYRKNIESIERARECSESVERGRESGERRTGGVVSLLSTRGFRIQPFVSCFVAVSFPAR